MAQQLHIKPFLQAEVDLVRTMVIRKPLHGYVNLTDFVLQHGRQFTPTKRLPKGIRCGKLKTCYTTAGRIAIDRDDLIYCEGFACGVIPVMHAWLVDKEGNVIDPTWRQTVDGVDYRGVEYFGVPISHEYFTEHLCKYEKYALIDAWEHGWPMLKDSPEKFLHPQFKTA